MNFLLVSDTRQRFEVEAVPFVCGGTNVPWMHRAIPRTMAAPHIGSAGGRSGTFYSPTAAVIAQSNAAAQKEAMVAATIETGQRNMAVLEQAVIKDNTLMPGEWYGGQLHLAPPTDQAGGAKTYTIIITAGGDRHVVEVSQGPAGT